MTVERMISAGRSRGEEQRLQQVPQHLGSATDLRVAPRANSARRCCDRCRYWRGWRGAFIAAYGAADCRSHSIVPLGVMSSPAGYVREDERTEPLYVSSVVQL
ncbi:hypothetical protein DOTSEDRAFT_68175, partial [Dothistroma septosporum NZE10]